MENALNENDSRAALFVDRSANKVYCNLNIQINFNTNHLILHQVRSTLIVLVSQIFFVFNFWME